MALMRIKIKLRNSIIRRYNINIPNLLEYEKTKNATYISGLVTKEMVQESIIKKKVIDSGKLLKSFRIIARKRKANKKGKVIPVRTVTVQSKLVYSRIQDLGGNTGVGGSVKIKARHYTKLNKVELRRRIIKELKK